jgi:hypothetical protein
MPLFICRWQNGDFSAVSAASKTDAIALLDEVGNAELCELFTVKNFMVHFRLKQETDEIDDFVPVELEGFGEVTVDILSERVYPAYFKTAMTEGENWPDHDEDSPEKVEPCSRTSMQLSSRSAPGSGAQRNRRFQPTRRRLTFRKPGLNYRRPSRSAL